MKVYHYIDTTGNQCGPYPLHELKNYPIKKHTLVWTSGMADWVEARTISDLEFLFDEVASQAQESVAPPPSSTPYQQATSQNNETRTHGVLDGAMPLPKNWLVESILITVLCCLPFGVAGIISASKVESLYRIGDYEGSLKASKDAKKWTMVGLISSLVFWVLYILFFVFVGFAETMFS